MNPVSLSDRHSVKNRPPKDHSHDPVHGAGHHHDAGAHLKRDQTEELASKMMQVGSDYIVNKTEGRYTEDELPHGPSAIAQGMQPEAMANKIIKEAAREMERNEGIVAAGGEAAMAQRVAMHRDDPSAPEYQVKKRIQERIASAEEHAAHGGSTFLGPNPDKGRDPNNAKMRHLGGGKTGEPYVTGGFKSERNPDVSKPRR